MPYDPRTTNKAGEIYGEYLTGAANAQAAGIRAGAAGMSSGISTAGSALAGGIQQAGQAWQQQAQKQKAEADLWSALNTKIATYGKMGYLSPQDADALAGIKKPNDLAAALTVIEQDIGRRQQAQQQSQQQNDMFNRQYAIAKMNHDQKVADALAKTQSDAQGPQLGEPIVIEDPITKEKTTWIRQNKEQITRLNPNAKNSPVTGVTKKEISPGEFIYTDQSGNMIDPKMVRPGGDTGELTDAQKAQRAQLAALQNEQARLTGEVAKGNKRPGPDSWTWPFDTYENRLKGVTAQINTLQGGAPSGPPVTEAPSATALPAGPAAAPAQYTNDADVIAAVKAGKLPREEAIKILMNLHQ